MKKKHIIFVFLIVISITINISFIGNAYVSIGDSAAKPNSANLNLKTNLADDKNSIIISGAGDCTLGNDAVSKFNGSFIDVFNKNNNDYSYFFKNVKSIFEKDDLTIVNLETTLTTATDKLEKEFRFKGDPAYTNILIKGNIDAVNIANNHIHDYLQKGFDDTVKALKNSNLGFFGEGYIYSKTIKGIKIGMLGYRAWDNSKYLKYVIKRDIKKLKKIGDQLIIVSFHWGEEAQNYPIAIQEDMGRFTIDNGADLILGTHPHVMESIERYKNKYIVYSLGNFSFGGSKNPSDKDTFIFQQRFGITNGKLNLINPAKVIPCSISSVGYKNNYEPTPLTGKDWDRIIGRLNTYSSGYKVKIAKDGSLNYGS
jgi:poly-gamma-glutamate capsule biosynthesis protein CapA/YwtB (metallophosphatase superfamily)